MKSFDLPKEDAHRIVTASAEGNQSKPPTNTSDWEGEVTLRKGSHVVVEGPI